MDPVSVVAAVIRPGATLGARDERTAFALPLLDSATRVAPISSELVTEMRAARQQGRAAPNADANREDERWA